MAVAYRTSTAGGGTSSSGNRSGAAITPVVGDLFIVFANTSGNTNAAPTCADNNGGTYTLIGTALKNASADTISVFVRNQLLTNTTSTTVTVTTGSNTAGEIITVAVSGMDAVGAAAIRSSGFQANQAAGTTPAPALNQAALSTNMTISGVGSGSSVSAVPNASWTEAQDAAQTSPTTGAELNYRNSGFTGTTVTYGGTTATAYASFVIELDGAKNVSITESGASADTIQTIAMASVTETASAVDVSSVVLNAAASVHDFAGTVLFDGLEQSAGAGGQDNPTASVGTVVVGNGQALRSLIVDQQVIGTVGGQWYRGSVYAAAWDGAHYLPTGSPIAVTDWKNIEPYYGQGFVRHSYDFDNNTPTLTNGTYYVVVLEGYQFNATSIYTLLSIIYDTLDDKVSQAAPGYPWIAGLFSLPSYYGWANAVITDPPLTAIAASNVTSASVAESVSATDSSGMGVSVFCIEAPSDDLCVAIPFPQVPSSYGTNNRQYGWTFAGNGELLDRVVFHAYLTNYGGAKWQANCFARADIYALTGTRGVNALPTGSPLATGKVGVGATNNDPTNGLNLYLEISFDRTLTLQAGVGYGVAFNFPYTSVFASYPDLEFYNTAISGDNAFGTNSDGGTFFLITPSVGGEVFTIASATPAPDAASASFITNVAVVEAVTATDTVNFCESVGEAVTATDAEDAVVVGVVSLAESGAAADVISSTAILGVPSSEIGTATDTPNATLLTDASTNEPGAFPQGVDIFVGTYSTGLSTNGLGLYGGAAREVSQTFTGKGYPLSWISAYLSKSGSPTGPIAVSVYATSGGTGSRIPTGSPLATSTFTVDASQLSSVTAQRCYTSFDGTFVPQIGVHYAVVLSFSTGDASNYVRTLYTTLNTYPSEDASYTTNGGSTWTQYSTGYYFFVIEGLPQDLVSSTAILSAQVAESGAATEATSASIASPVAITESGSADGSTDATVSSGGNVWNDGVVEASSGVDVSDSANNNLVTAVTESGTASDSQNAMYTGAVIEGAAATDSTDNINNNLVSDLTESASVSDSASSAYSTAASQDEAVAGTDASDRGVLTVGDIAESGASVDVLDRTIITPAAGVEGGAAGDVVAGGYTVSHDEAATAVDGIGAYLNAVSSQSDAGTAADNVGGTYSTFSDQADAATATDASGGIDWAQAQEVDTATATGSQDASFVSAPVVVDESGNAIDSVDRAVAYPVATAESASAVDAQDAVSALVVAVAEAVAGIEVTDAIQQAVVTAIEALSSGDASTAAADLVVAQDESVTVLDSSNSPITRDVAIVEAAVSTEASDRTVDTGVSSIESGGAGDSIAGGYAVDQPEATSAVDAVGAVSTIITSTYEFVAVTDGADCTYSTTVDEAEAVIATDASGDTNWAQAQETDSAGALEASDASYVSADELVTESLSALSTVDRGVDTSGTTTAAVTAADTSTSQNNDLVAADTEIAAATATHTAIRSALAFDDESTTAADQQDSINNVWQSSVAESVSAVDSSTAQNSAVGVVSEHGAATDLVASFHSVLIASIEEGASAGDTSVSLREVPASSTEAATATDDPSSSNDAQGVEAAVAGAVDSASATYVSAPEAILGGALAVSLSSATYDTTSAQNEAVGASTDQGGGISFPPQDMAEAGASIDSSASQLTALGQRWEQATSAVSVSAHNDATASITEAAAATDRIEGEDHVAESLDAIDVSSGTVVARGEVLEAVASHDGNGVGPCSFTGIALEFTAANDSTFNQNNDLHSRSDEWMVSADTNGGTYVTLEEVREYLSAVAEEGRITNLRSTGHNGRQVVAHSSKAMDILENEAHTYTHSAPTVIVQKGSPVVVEDLVADTLITVEVGR